jgi:hypothetical protein
MPGMAPPDQATFFSNLHPVPLIELTGHGVLSANGEVSDPLKLSAPCRLVLPDHGGNLTLPQVQALRRNKRPILAGAGTRGRR